MEARVVEEHGDWLIWHDPLPVAFQGENWCFVHKDFGGEHVGCDPRMGRDESREMCLQTIDWLDSEQEREVRETDEDRKPSEAYLNFINVPLVKQLGAALSAANSILACNGRGFADGVLRSQVATGMEAYRAWQSAQGPSA